MSRWVLASLALVVVVALLAWQWRRERMITECLQAGGAWDGPASRCLKTPPSPFLKRGIERG